MNDSNTPPPKRSRQRRKPKQHRSVETMNAILEAGSSLFEEQGYEKTTTHQIAARAGVSVGALYRYFTDKEAILKEIYKRENSLLRDRILEEFATISIADRDPGSLVREALGRALKIYAERPKLRMVLGEQSRKVQELIILRRQQEDDLHRTIGRIFTSVPEIQLPDIEVSSYLTALFMESVIEDYLLHRRNHSTFTTERILDVTTDFLLSFLLRPRGQVG